MDHPAILATAGFLAVVAATAVLVGWLRLADCASVRYNLSLRSSIALALSPFLVALWALFYAGAAGWLPS